MSRNLIYDSKIIWIPSFTADQLSGGSNIIDHIGAKESLHLNANLLYPI